MNLWHICSQAMLAKPDFPAKTHFGFVAAKTLAELMCSPASKLDREESNNLH